MKIKLNPRNHLREYKELYIKYNFYKLEMERKVKRHKEIIENKDEKIEVLRIIISVLSTFLITLALIHIIF